MAQYPCSRCAHRYVGPQSTVYPAFVGNGTTISGRLRLCPPCLRDVLAIAALIEVDQDSADPIEECYSCGAESPDVAVFMPYYPAGEGRHDRYARLCQEPCASEVLERVTGTYGGLQRRNGAL